MCPVSVWRKAPQTAWTDRSRYQPQTAASAPSQQPSSSSSGTAGCNPSSRWVDLLQLKCFGIRFKFMLWRPAVGPYLSCGPLHPNNLFTKETHPHEDLNTPWDPHFITSWYFLLFMYCRDVWDLAGNSSPTPSEHLFRFYSNVKMGLARLNSPTNRRPGLIYLPIPSQADWANIPAREAVQIKNVMRIFYT